MSERTHCANCGGELDAEKPHQVGDCRPPSPTLTEFLLARIGEDEAAALQSDSRRWDVDLSGYRIVSIASEGGVGIVMDEDGNGLPVRRLPWIRPGERTTRVVSCSREHRVRGQDGCSIPHIVRHDPARVLAEAAAKRTMVVAYAEAVHYYGVVNRSAPAGEVSGMETMLKHLAAVYADHPDYDEAW